MIQEQQQRSINKIDKTILDNFYKLVHSQPNVRLTAAASTLKILVALKKRKFENFNENLNYSIDRLVAGLASSRALARRGYGTLLLGVLSSFQVSTERLFTTAHQKFGHISKETTRDNLIGYFLLITIVLQSKNHNRSKANNQYLEKIYKHLSQLMTIKSYLEYSVSKLLVDYYELFHSYMLTDINPETLGSDTKLTSSDLLILILCHKKEPIRRLASLGSSEVKNLYSVLLDEKFQKRPLQPVFLERNHNELAAMGLEYTSEMLKLIDNPTAINTLLSEHLITLLILTLRTRKPLHTHCTKFFNSLKQLFEQLNDKPEDINQSDARQYNILLRLTSSPGSIAFDEDSKSSSINNLLQASSPAVLKKYLSRILSILQKENLKAKRQKILLSCTRQIAHIVRRPQMVEDQSTLLMSSKFLLLNSLFKPSEESTDPNEEFWTSQSIPKPVSPFEEPVRAALKNSYHATLDHIISACNPQERIDQLGNLITFVNQLLNSKDIEYIGSQSENHESVDTLWSHYLAKLQSHEKLVAKQKEPKQLYPITTLYLFYGLQVIEHELDCVSQLGELEQSAQECLKGDPKDGTWADVLTDQIIAILSATECSPWIRKLCTKVFGSLLPHISQASIDLLCDAIKSPVEEEDSDGMDCDDEEDQSEPESVELKGHKGETSKDEGESSVDSDEDSEDMECDEEINQEGKKSASLNDEEESEEEYLDDEQMMKLDPIIADMFRKKKDDPSFKLRCLDLIKKIVVKKHNDTETINTILATLIPLAASSRQKSVADKINTMLAKMPRKNRSSLTN